MRYTGCDGESYVKFDAQMWVVLYCTGDEEPVRSETWTAEMIKENLTEHYEKRGCDVLVMERAGVVVAAIETIKEAMKFLKEDQP